MNTAKNRASFGGRLLVVLALLVLIVISAWLLTVIAGGGGNASGSLPGPYDNNLVKQGEYLSKVGDCAACHTAQGGKEFAGGLPIQSPLGVIYSSNITPDKETGIGGYTYGQFERAVRHGIARSGDTLYPAMPYPSYSRISDADVKALYAYFMQGVTPVNQANKPTGIPWPLSMRWPLTYWRWMFAPKVPVSLVEQSGSAIDRGRYLVEGLGHCGACHTPRALTLQEKALSDKEGASYLSGGEADHWVAPSLRGDAADGLGSLSHADLVSLLKTGRSENSAIFGGMSDVVHQSTQYLSDDDLNAVAAYLKSLPTSASPQLTADDSVAKALHSGDVSKPGAQLYVDSCAACHRTSGSGYAQTFPTLALNPVVNSANPDSLIHLVLAGSTMPGTKTAPTEFSMPSFSDRLNDKDVAQLLTFVRSSWGNKAPAVTEDQVRKVREALPKTAPVMTSYDPRNTAPSP